MRTPFQAALAFCVLPAALGLFAIAAQAQQADPTAKPSAEKLQARADEHKLPTERGEIVDRIAATVNGELILRSDV